MRNDVLDMENKIKSEKLTNIIIKNCKKNKKTIEIFSRFVYTTNCCGMIAMKREVVTQAKASVGFPWSECQII